MNVIRETNGGFDRCNSCKSAICVNYISQNFRLFHLLKCCVPKFRFSLLMCPGPRGSTDPAGRGPLRRRPAGYLKNGSRTHRPPATTALAGNGAGPTPCGTRWGQRWTRGRRPTPAQPFGKPRASEPTSCVDIQPRNHGVADTLMPP